MGKANRVLFGLSLWLGASVSAYAVDPDYSFTGCSSFNLGYGLNVTLDYQGQVKCYDTYSSSPTKLEAVAINQPSGVNYNIYVYWYNSATATLEFQGSGTKTGNFDERPQMVVPAGNYLIYTEAVSGYSATTFVVGALNYPSYDAHEMNDTALTATEL